MGARLSIKVGLDLDHGAHEFRIYTVALGSRTDRFLELLERKPPVRRWAPEGKGIPALGWDIGKKHGPIFLTPINPIGPGFLGDNQPEERNSAKEKYFCPSGHPKIRKYIHGTLLSNHRHLSTRPE
jgi:hypothetical protein